MVSDFTTFNDNRGGVRIKTMSAEQRNSMSCDMPVNESIFIY